MNKILKKIVSICLVLTFFNQTSVFPLNLTEQNLAPETRARSAGFRSLFEEAYFEYLNFEQIKDFAEKGRVPEMPEGVKRVVEDASEEEYTLNELKFLNLNMLQVINRVKSKAGLKGEVGVKVDRLETSFGQIASLEADPDNRTLTVDPRFLKDIREIEENDVEFIYQFPGTDRERHLRLSQAIKHFAAMHELRWAGKQGGHFYLEGDDIKFDPSEDVTNRVGKNYSLVMAAMWLWFENAYLAGAFDERLRYSLDHLEQRIDDIFFGQSEYSRTMRSEFPVLLDSEANLSAAKKMVLWLNYQYFIRPFVEKGKFFKSPKSVITDPLAGREMISLDNPGTGPIFHGDKNYEYIKKTQLTGRPVGEINRDVLRKIRNLIKNRADIPGSETAVDILTAIVRGENDKYLYRFGEDELAGLDIELIDLRDKTYFSPVDGYQRCYSFMDYDPAEQRLKVRIAKAFYEKYADSNINVIAQAILYPILARKGMEHQEIIFSLNRLNSDDTINSMVSDIHRAMLKEIKSDALNLGDAAAIAYLNSILEPELKMPENEIDKLKSAGWGAEDINEARIKYEEYARQINTIVRGPVGLSVRASDISEIRDLTGFSESRKPQNDEILKEHSLALNATIAAALAVVADGYSGCVNDLTAKAEVKIAKDGADGLAKKEIQVIFNMLGDYRIVVTVSEGGLRDEVEESFSGGDTVGKGMFIKAISLDVVENTTATAYGKPGGTSIAVGANDFPRLTPEQIKELENKGIDPEEYVTNMAALGLGGLAPDVYANIVAFKVPEDKINDFAGDNVINPDSPVKDIIGRIKDATGRDLDDMEIIILGRNREEKRLKALKTLSTEYIFNNISADQTKGYSELIREVIEENGYKDANEVLERLIYVRNLLFIKEAGMYSKEIRITEKDNEILEEILLKMGLPLNITEIAGFKDEEDKLSKEGHLLKALLLEEKLENGLKIRVIQDGTYMPGLEAIFGKEEGRMPVLLSSSGAPEAFMDLQQAKIFHKKGAVCSLKIMSNKALKGKRDLSDGYDFVKSESNLITDQRESQIEGDGKPDDHQQILNGEKIFTVKDIPSTDLDGAVTFITFNEIFRQNGIRKIDENHFKVTTLRSRLLPDGEAYLWLEDRVFIIEAEGPRDITNEYREDIEAASLRAPGTKPLLKGSYEEKDIKRQIKTGKKKPIDADTLINVRDIIGNKTETTIVVYDLLTSLIRNQEINTRLKKNGFVDKPVESIQIKLADAGDKTYFSAGDSDSRYYNFTDYDEEAKELSIYIPKGFYQKYAAQDSPDRNMNVFAQSILYAFLEEISGLTHQQIVFLLCQFNSVDTLPAPGNIVVNDINRAIIAEIKKEAYKGDVKAIGYLNGLMNPAFLMPDSQLNALKASGLPVREIDGIRKNYEELARQMNTLIRKPLGFRKLYMTGEKVENVKNIEYDLLPPGEVLAEESLAANATIAAALAVVADGYRGKVKDLISKAETRIIKDQADGLAKKEIQVVFNQSGYRIVVTVSEGGLRDGVEESFVGGDMIGRGLEIKAIALDVIENTNATATGNFGGTSIAVASNDVPEMTEELKSELEKKGIDPSKYLANMVALGMGGLAPDVYANIVLFRVPEDKIDDFTGDNVVDPDAPVGEILDRLTSVNNKSLEDLEVIILGRNREEHRLKELKRIAVEYLMEKNRDTLQPLIDKVLESREFAGENVLRRFIVRTLTLRFLDYTAKERSKEFQLNTEDREFLAKMRQKEETGEYTEFFKLVSEIERMDNAGKTLAIRVIQDGTYIPGLQATFGRKEGRMPVLLSTSGAPEAFMNLHGAKIFNRTGVVGFLKIMSNKALKGVRDLSTGYDFVDSEVKLITDQRQSRIEGDGRTDDAVEILTGQKIFTVADILSTDLDGSVTFITYNDNFGEEGIRVEGDKFYVTTLRTRLTPEGKSYAWIEKRTFSFNAKDGFVQTEPNNKTRAGGERDLSEPVEKTLLEDSVNDIPASAEHVEKYTKRTHDSLSSAELDKSHQREDIVVLMNEDLLDTEKLESQELKQQYDRMLQNIDRNFNGREKGLVKIESVDHLQFEAVRFLSEGKKVVILDANGMFQNADIDPVFNDRFCVIDSEIKNDLDPEKEAQFINLYGLSNLGIGILFRNGDIFRNAYIAITGTAPDEAILKEVLMGNLPVINLLPLIVKFDINSFDEENRITRLFKASA